MSLILGKHSESGQAQILMALVMGFAIFVGAFFALEYAQKTSTSQVMNVRKSEIRGALDAAVKHAAYLYHHESSCDPVKLNQKLARMALNGSIGQNPGLWQMDVTINPLQPPIRVAFSAATRYTWTNTVDPSLLFNPGTSQDAIVEVWARSGNVRLSQSAILVNNCTYPCNQLAGQDGYCMQNTALITPEILYGTINDPAAYGLNACQGSTLGDLTQDGVIDVRDILVFRNYLRSGSTAGSTTSTLLGGPGISCADFNNDALVDEIDLSILEKALRGYLHTLPTM